MSNFHCGFEIYIKFQTFRKKNGPHNSSISQISDLEICGYLNI